MIVEREDDLDAWRREWANYHVLLAMTRLGFFDLMADGQSRSAEQLARDLDADARAVDICSRILVHAGLLSFEDGNFRLAESARKLLIPINELKLEWGRAGTYAGLLETIRSGHPAIPTSGGVIQDDEAYTRQFLTRLHRHSAAGVREATRIIEQLGSVANGNVGPMRILDLGGGHGRYATAFAQALPGAAVTLFDREIVIPIARELSGEGFATRSGDFMKDDLGGPYHIVFMGGIVSGIERECIQPLLGRVRGVLAADGAVVIEDVFVDPETHLYPASAIDFHLTLLLENERGRCRTVPELADLLKAAGFVTCRHIPIEGHDFSFVVGQ